MEIYFAENENIPSEITDLMMKAAEYCLAEEGVDAGRCEISVTFADTEEIHSLNREYRNVDRPTDVLSFPQFENPGQFPKTGEICLGDVVICADRAAEQAAEYGHSTERELIYLFVHSVLHLLGYDHMEENEKAIMRQREETIMERIGLPR